MIKKDFMEPVAPDWERTNTEHVWYNTKEGVYAFEDEVGYFIGVYATEGAAKDQLKDYAEKYL